MNFEKELNFRKLRSARVAARATDSSCFDFNALINMKYKQGESEEQYG